MIYPLWQSLRDRANQSAFLKRYYPNLRNRYHGFVRFFQMAAIYGLKITFGLYRIRRICRTRNSLIDRRLRLLADSMAGENRVAGSATKEGWLYHDFPLPECNFISHRKNSLARIRKISHKVPIDRARVLDLGCSTGGISIGLALLNASKVIGVDYDCNAIALAQAAAEKYGISNVEFHFSRAEAFEIPEVDILIWLSNWMWIVKQHGLDYAKDLLFNIPKKANAQFMAFESAAADGKAPIKGIGQDDILRFLKQCSPFTKFENIGPFQDSWRAPGQERMVFICSEPEFFWQGKEATIKRVDRHSVIKTFEPQRKWAKDIESLCLRRLDSSPHFPKLIEEGDDWIRIEWAGHRVSRPDQLGQLDEIVRILAANNIQHRDICLENLLFREELLTLIDFGWSIVDGRETLVKPPDGLGRGFYDAENRNDAHAVEYLKTWLNDPNNSARL